MRTLILLASYNGKHYIKEQINSLIGQTFKDWELIVRDDGSSDGTVYLLEEFERLDKRVTILCDAHGQTGSAEKNFSLLLNHAQSLEPDYIFLCDQDDVWFPTKLEVFINTYKKLSLDNLTPALIHSDLEVVDKSLHPISSSFFNVIGLQPEAISKVNSLVFQNAVTGCASMINSALLNKIVPIPKSILMHDWWLALVASSFGRVAFIPEATVKYRQHGTNSVGALSYLTLCNPFSKLSRKAIYGSSAFIENCYEQIFNLRVLLLKNDFDTSKVDKLLNSAKYSRFIRIVKLIRNGCMPTSKGRMLGFVIRHLLTSRKRLKKYAH